jgi:hypothetical protein
MSEIYATSFPEIATDPISYLDAILRAFGRMFLPTGNILYARYVARNSRNFTRILFGELMIPKLTGNRDFGELYGSVHRDTSRRSILNSSRGTSLAIRRPSRRKKAEQPKHGCKVMFGHLELVSWGSSSRVDLIGFVRAFKCYLLGSSVSVCVAVRK